MARELREPLPPGEFDRLPLHPSVLQLTPEWWNLRWAEHATSERLFYVSATARLTPLSGTVPCVYFACDQATAFAELYADQIQAAAVRSAPMRIAQRELKARLLVRPDATVALKLFDLTVARSAKSIGLDLATLYTADVKHPRAFAERLNHHPSRFDGIRFLSRHTQAPCVVLWATYNEALRNLPIAADGDLWSWCSASEDLPIGAVQLFGETIRPIMSV